MSGQYGKRSVQLRWTELALADLDRIETWVATESSPIVAIDVVLKVVDTTFRVLVDHPGAGRIGRVKGTRELVISGLPFIVVYRQGNVPGELQLLRVLHTAQNWPGEER